MINCMKRSWQVKENEKHSFFVIYGHKDINVNSNKSMLSICDTVHIFNNSTCSKMGKNMLQKYERVKTFGVKSIKTS